MVLDGYGMMWTCIESRNYPLILDIITDFSLFTLCVL